MEGSTFLSPIRSRRPSFFTSNLEQPLVGYWDWQIDQDRIFLSNSFTSMLGYYYEESPIDAKSLQKLLHPNDVDILLENIKVHIDSKGEIPYEHKIRFLHKNNSEILVHCEGNVIEWDTKGEALRMVGTCTNVTRRKRVLKELNEYKTLFDLSEDPMCICDKNGKIIQHNKAFEQFAFFTKKIIAESSFTDIIFTKTAEKEEFLNQLSNDEMFSFESLHQNTVKEILQFKWSLTKHTDSGQFYCVAKNVSAIKERKRKLRATAAILQESQEVAQLGHWEFNLIENIVYWSAITRAIHEVDENFVPTVEKAIQFYDNDSIDIIRNAIKDSIEYGKHFDLRLGIYTVTKKHKWVRVKGKPVFQNDSIVKITGIFQDITEDKEKELMLIEARRKAEAAAKAKEEFLSTMSHEIRTPLNSVIGMSHLLMDEKPREDQLPRLKTLKFSAEHLLSLINDILDYNKIESGQLELEKVSFNILEIIEGVYSVMSYKAEEKNIKLKRIVDQQLPLYVIGDPIRFTQILNNLVSNAIKFTEKGNVKIILELENETEDRVQLLVTVKDSGIGISKEKLETVFNRFTQAENSTTRRYGGTGLGLAITKNLLQLFGSEIHVNSKEGKGSEFYFYIDFKKCKHSTGIAKQGNNQLHTRKSSKNSIKDLGGLKILLVEDNPTNQLVASQFLNRWNVNLEIASNGSEAIKKIAIKKDYDVILMDLQMPEMDGLETTKKIKKEYPAFFDKVHILALSAASFSSVNDKIKKVGMSGYIPKPFNPEDLYDKIWKIINQKEVTLSNKQSNSEVIVHKDGFQYISLKKIQELLNLGENFLHEYLKISKDQIKEFKDLTNQAFIARDAALFQQQKHKSKTNFSQLGAFEIEEYLDKLEKENIFRASKKTIEVEANTLSNKLDDIMMEIDQISLSMNKIKVTVQS